MRRIGVCMGCPNRKRIVTDDYIYDCHMDCQTYKDAYNRETEQMNKAIKARQPDTEMLRYYTADKEKRRRKHL